MDGRDEEVIKDRRVGREMFGVEMEMDGCMIPGVKKG